MTLIIRDTDGFRDIGKVFLKDGVVKSTALSPRYIEGDPLYGMKGFMEKSVREYAAMCAWRIEEVHDES